MGIDVEHWMSQTLMMNGAGELTLRSIVLPASHDSGMSFCQKQTTFANEASTVTQVRRIAEQLRLGVRVFDIRPIIKDKRYLCGHVEKLGSPIGWQGGFGEAISDIVTAVNEFNQHAKELVILNIHDWSCFNGDADYRDFNDSEWTGLFDELKKLEHRFTPTDKEKDLRDYPLKDIINDKLAVICIMSQWRGEPKLGELHGKGFFKSTQFHSKDSNLFLTQELSHGLIGLSAAENIVDPQIDGHSAIPKGLNPYLGLVKLGQMLGNAIENGKPELERFPIVAAAKKRNTETFPTIWVMVGFNPPDFTPKHAVVQADAIESDLLATQCLLATVYCLRLKYTLSPHK